MAITLDGTTGITTPGLTNTGTETVVNLTTTGNTTLGDATTDTLNVGAGGIVKDASGNVGIGTSSPTNKLHVSSSSFETIKLQGTSTVSGINFVNSASSNGYIYYDNGPNMLFYTNASERMRIDSSGNLLVNTTTAQTGAKLSVTGGISGTITSATAVASTSGTSIDFTSIPSWVKRITVMFSGVSTNGSSVVQLQIGAGSVTTSGYLGGAYVTNSNANNSTGFLTSSTAGAGDTRFLIATLATLGSNMWGYSFSGGYGNGAYTAYGGGGLTLGGTLDRVRITTVNGTDTFDAGSINILYEG